jgi:hypothetical protein
MSDISHSAIKTTPELEEALKNASTADEMKSILAEAAVRQGLVTRDFYDPSVLLVNDRVVAPSKISRSITVDGQKLNFEGDDEASVEQAMAVYMRTQMRPVETRPEVQVEIPRDERGRFTRADDPVARVELELKFKRGEVTVEEYLAESGAVDDYLKSQGVSIDELKSSVEQTRNEKTEKSWQQATREFLNSPEGSDWPGGQENLKIAGRLLEENGLVDSPTAENLVAVYRCMKENGMVVENPEITRANKISEAKTYSEIQEALGSHGSLFGH